MGIAAEIEPEMTEIVRAVDGLRLGPQHHFIDDVLLLGAGDAAEIWLKCCGFITWPWGGRCRSSRGNRASARTFSCEGDSWMRKKRHLVLRQFRGRDIGGDHELLDQAMRGQSLGRHHALDQPMGIEDQPALRHVELERRAAVTGSLERAIDGP